MAVNTVYTALRTGQSSHLILVSDSDFFFKDTTTATLTDADATHPTLTVQKVKAVGSTKRHLIIKYKATPKKPPPVVPGTGDVETATVTVTTTDPAATTVVGVAYVDDP